MIRMKQILTVANAEMRLTRRLVRYWVFLAISYLIGLVAYFYYSVIHGLFSSYSATVATIGPRFLIGAFGIYLFLVFMVGIVFLGFDIRARDRRERMTEVLDSRPYSNLELVAGKFLGLLLPTWIPIVILAGIWQVFGLLLPALGAPFGDTLQPTSVIAFIFLMTLPGLAFVLALVFLVTLLVRNRLVAAVLLLVILGVDFWAGFWLPMIYGPICDISGALVINFPSDIIPGFSNAVGWLQRIAVLIATMSFIGFAAAVHPRLDGGSRQRTALAAMGLFIVAAFFSGFGVVQRAQDLKVIEGWRDAHAAQAEVPVPDLQSISGEVTIDPGRNLELELALVFRAPPGKPMEKALFTLNPGLKVSAARDASGRDLAFTFENGLLDLDLPSPLEGEEARIHLSLGGLPDRRFGYLNSARTTEAMKGVDGNLFLLGFERAIFDRRFVALMPGIRWLPTSGSEKDRDNPRKRTRDFFNLDLTVRVPEGWLVAGPGRRLDAEGGAFRFAPPASVPGAALMASEFESRSTEIEGVVFEILVHPKHAQNLEVLADTSEEINTWIRERMSEAKASGLGYPYDALTLVEVPAALRGYAGGWRMDTALAPPAMLLMRETSFPTARFDSAFRKPDEFKDREGGLARAKRDRLRAFFVNDFTGGNLFIGAARNFFVYQTAARGPEGLALDFVMENLSTLLLTDSRGYFSAHIFDAEMGQAIGTIMQSYFSDRSSPDRTFADAAIEAFTARPEVWDAALGTALTDLDPWEDPARTVDVLTVKGGAVARSIHDALGPEKTGKLLASLRKAHQGQSYSFEDVKTACRAMGEDVEGLLGDWLNTTELAGFVGGSTDAYRLRDTVDGTPRYQLQVTVRNDEPVPGIFRIHYWIGRGNESERVISEPIRLGGKRAIRFATLASKPPTLVLIEPYISLNRTSFRVPMRTVDEEKIVRVEPLEGTEDVPWEEPEEAFVVVDDLDEGFGVTEGEDASGLRLGARARGVETDQGLPLQLFGGSPSTWSRMINVHCFGKYRHTMAVIRAGSGKRKAVFTAPIPTAGQWDLELHMTNKDRFGRTGWGNWEMNVVASSNPMQVNFDSGAGTQGWNLVGTFDLPEGKVAVELSDKTDGRIVVADAIRWSPSAGNTRKEDQ